LFFKYIFHSEVFKYIYTYTKDQSQYNSLFMHTVKSYIVTATCFDPSLGHPQAH